MPLIRDIGDLREARDWVVRRHQPWKRRIYTNDLVASGQWATVWDDLQVEAMDPVVENILLEAIEDKAAAAAAVAPLVHVGPTSGTRRDRGEKQAQKKRKVFVSYMTRSKMDKLRESWFMDWFVCGARYSMPWTNWNDPVRQPFLMRHDPRHVYPLAHDGLGNMTAAFVVKVRRAVDIRNEWGADHPAFRELNSRHNGVMPDGYPLEEVWTYDMHTWSMALLDANDGNSTSQWRYLTPTRTPAADAKTGVWVVEPELHNLSRCPLVESKRTSWDDEYRGAVDVMVPGLKTAQHLMVRIIEDVNLNIYAPMLFDNIENPEDYGPSASLIGTGQGPARAEPVRSPINFEAGQRVEEQLEGVRRAGKYPQQRGGEPGASIVSAKGNVSLMGSFNTEQAQAQRDQQRFEQDSLALCAEFDEKWCPGEKKTVGFDQGELFDVTYDAARLFDGDYRVSVTYGGTLGLDDSTFLIRLQTLKQLGAISDRTFMTKSGMVENVIREENEMAEEAVHKGYLGFMMQQAAAGNMDPLNRLIEAIDGKDTTARADLLQVARETFAVPESGAGGGGPGGAAPDPVLLARSQAAGGSPNSEGQARVRNTLASVLPGPIRRAIGEAAPGGTAA